MRVEKFVVWSDAPGFEPPQIMVLDPPPAPPDKPNSKLTDAVRFLQDAVERMTRHPLVAATKPVPDKGIVFTTLAAAPPDIANDPKVRVALLDDGTVMTNEAYYVRTEQARTILVANTFDGLVNAVADLAESVDYYVLGMGPNWVTVPDHRQSLVFETERGGRPGFAVRQLAPNRTGTISTVTDPADEPVAKSELRWRVGARLAGSSIPTFPGHALHVDHPAVLRKMLAEKRADGFLLRTEVGAHADRPATADGQLFLWINNDAPGSPHADEMYLWQVTPSNVWGWTLLDPAKGVYNGSVDLSVEMVRETVLERVWNTIEGDLAKTSDEIIHLTIDPEDSGATDAQFEQFRKNHHWYEKYLETEGLPFRRPYALFNQFDIKHPFEEWDPLSRSDTIFGFAIWILREVDKRIDKLPKEQQVTSTGKSKKSRLRASFMSYNYHDVVPSFNIDDPRVRVMVAANGPKHRGVGKWASLVSDIDVFTALRTWLPEVGTYRITSYANSIELTRDWGLHNLPVTVDFSAKGVSDDLDAYYRADVRAVQAEIDFNFGKFGLGYYLMAKKMWQPTLSIDGLDAVRDEWLQRAFGSAWEMMKEYYDFMLSTTFPVNSTSSWLHAMDLIDAAEAEVPDTEPAVKLRIDDLKQYLYYYYLQDTLPEEGPTLDHRTFVWRGQMSYMNAMHGILSQVFHGQTPADAAGKDISDGPAHYSPVATGTWWGQMRQHWSTPQPQPPIVRFEDATLADGTPARDIDQNDLVLVDEFTSPGPETPIYFNPTYYLRPTFLAHANRAGDAIGFQAWWKRYPWRERRLHYGLDWWDPRGREWRPILDPEKTTVPDDGVGEQRVIRVEHTAPRAGTFRFYVHWWAADSIRLAPLTYDIPTNTPTGRAAHTYHTLIRDRSSGSSAFFYIPKGTGTLDLDLWSAAEYTLTLYSGLPSTSPPPTVTATVPLSGWHTHRVNLKPEDGGTVARLTDKGWLYFPYLHSVPRLWAKSPTQLLVPRAVAIADGLTITES